MNRALLGLCLLLQLVRVVGQDMEEVATVERTVWDNLILASSKEVASRAGITLIRLWEEDGEALCHLTQVLASKSLILLADGACRQAERASPLLPCALACRAHFALWGCDFDLADDISRSLRGEMARRGEQGIPLGHVEALMLLPHRQFLEFMGAQARSLRAREEGEDGEDGGGNKFAMKVCESLKSRVVQVNLAILAAHPHDHPHGQVLLGALLGWKELRNRNVLSVTCYKTSAGAGGAGAGAGAASRGPAGGACIEANLMGFHHSRLIRVGGAQFSPSCQVRAGREDLMRPTCGGWNDGRNCEMLGWRRKILGNVQSGSRAGASGQRQGDWRWKTLSRKCSSFVHSSSKILRNLIVLLLLIVGTWFQSPKVASAKEGVGVQAEQAEQERVVNPNSRAWKEEFKGSELPLWAQFARRDVTLANMEDKEMFMTECKAVVQSPVEYVYVMTFGSLEEQERFLLRHSGVEQPAMVPSQGGAVEAAKEGEGGLVEMSPGFIFRTAVLVLSVLCISALNMPIQSPTIRLFDKASRKKEESVRKKFGRVVARGANSSAALLSTKIPGKQDASSYDFVVIGGGAAGLMAAGLGTSLGAKTVLIEADEIGGDCTNQGCVPSKALLHAGNEMSLRMPSWRSNLSDSLQDGADAPGAASLYPVKSHIQSVVARVKSHESAEAIQKAGISFIHGQASFKGQNKILVRRSDGNSSEIVGKKILICTGAEPKVPAIKGIRNVNFWTYRDLFKRFPSDRPAHLVIIGGGPVACEIGQAFRNLGSNVTIVAPSLLPRESSKVQEAMICLFGNMSGMEFVKGRADQVVKRTPGEVTVLLQSGKVVVGDQLLVAVGRKPRLSSLNLTNAGVSFSEEGIVVDEHQRTTVANIMAAGDCCTGQDKFSHVAGWQAFIATKAALLPWWLRGSISKSSSVVPRVVYTKPEVASVGLSEQEVQDKYGKVGRQWTKVSVTKSMLDRSLADEEAEQAFIEVYIHNDGQVLGSTMVSNRAGELVTLVAIAINNKIHVKDLATTIHPYPSYAFALHKLWIEAATRNLFRNLNGGLLASLMRFAFAASRIFSKKSKAAATQPTNEPAKEAQHG